MHLQQKLNETQKNEEKPNAVSGICKCGNKYNYETFYVKPLYSKQLVCLVN